MSEQQATAAPAVIGVADKVARPNDSGRVPVVFIHGL
jgi:hypothetical protein